MVLRSGDILVMGGKSRLRVHAVPKVFTKSLPPTYLHPKTAGNMRIHMEHCPCFLQRHHSIIDSFGSNSSRVESVSMKESRDSKSESYKRFSQDSSVYQDSELLSKRQKNFAIDTSSSVNAGLEYRRAIDCEENTTDKKQIESSDNELILDRQCCCECLSIQEEVRALRYLQTTRININFRQAYSDSEP